MSAPIFDAVTAVLVHGGALYVTRRQPHLPAFPGYYTFPGGKVDKTDPETPHPHPLLAAHPPRLMHALVRELREETGFDLEQAAGDGTVSAIHYLGEITTPAYLPVRFHTRFYKIVLKERPSLTPDAGEAVEADWVAVKTLCERYAKGRMLLAFPTLAVIEQLAADIDAGRVPRLDHRKHSIDLPWLEPLAGLRMILVRSNTLPPAHHTNCFWLGDSGSPRVLVDPSPESPVELERLCALLDEFGIDEVFLTHHHPDHREYADAVARRYGVPIGMSADTFTRIRDKTGGRFFEGLNVKTYSDGDVLTEWLGEKVKVLAVPGHDEGQLALMPESRAWCVVSDLIQGVGTVVVGGPEGNMRKYLDSLRKVIALDPDVIIPSHGAAMGTTYRLRETLKHREMREAQIKTLHDKGRSVDEMLPEIYQGIDPRLLPLARINIESHLQKLREDGAIA